MSAEEIEFDPEMKLAIKRMGEIAVENNISGERSKQTPEQARIRNEIERKWWNEDRPELAEILNTIVAGGPGGDIPVRILYPVGERPLGSIVYLHGGGWVMGSLETHARGMHYLALMSGMAVVAVDYTLAPDLKFPSQIEETAAVVRHIRDKGLEWGLDPNRITIAGDSAGANLAVGTAFHLQESDPGLIKALGLIYGVLGADFETDSYNFFGEKGLGLTRADMKFFFNHYLGNEADYADPRAVPMVGDVSKLPPCMVHAAGLDVLRDDSILFAEKLAAAGVEHELVVHEGVLHAFMGTTRMVQKAHTMIKGVAEGLSRVADRQVA